MEPAVRPCLIVEVEGERFGIDTNRIRTVVECRNTSPIPGRPSPFVGAFSHHGELLPVVPLAALLERRSRGDPARSAIVVLDWEDGLLGLLVERAFGLLTALDRTRLAHVLGRWEGPHLACTLEADGQTIHVLDTESLLSDLARRL